MFLFSRYENTERSESYFNDAPGESGKPFVTSSVHRFQKSSGSRFLAFASFVALSYLTKFREFILLATIPNSVHLKILYNIESNLQLPEL